ncbi:DUF3373 family protein [Sulfurospirillum arcachonense]|uniref:DUF3373 family protein n=1 Tax=Sulfurospirillum arcachonense TaxID=57666 RepID=UPI00046AE462|nr:DUF3373 family protein [Sulfurospirillum arcachonense]
MKKFIIPMLVGATLATTAMAEDSLRAEIAALKAQMAELKEAQSKINIDALKSQLSEVKAHSAGDNIKWSVDFRTAYDMLDYKIDGANDVSNELWTNKLTLGMAAQPIDNLVFKGALGMYKAYGQNAAPSNNGFQNMDWFSSQTPSGDSNIRLKEAYFLYFGNMGDMAYTASFGRRPSTDGFMTNLRADNPYPSSPVGHNINMEFDGASFKFDFDKLTGISGMYFKICLGRGNSNANAKYPTFTGFPVLNSVSPSTTYTPYAQSNYDSANMDLAGLLVQFYDDGQYKVMGNYFQGYSMMGANFAYTNGTSPAAGYNVNLTDVGDLSGGSLSVQVNGIGDEISDFLDDTIFFASYAFSKTDPEAGSAHNVIVDNVGTIGSMKEMLGSTKSETGSSYYVGVNMPGFMDSDRFGIEYNHGSKYWRSFTYGEDTLAGSKLATRGDAYEIYYNFPIVSKFLTGQIRYTRMDYDYTGSDMFFGSTGTPMDVKVTPGAVETAQNIRLSLRYRY